MNYKELQEFIKAVAKSGVSEVSIKTQDIKLDIRMHQKQNKPTETIIQQIPVANPLATSGFMPQAPQPQATPQTTAQPEQPKKDAEPEANENYIEIKSPMVGTFYRKPSPDKDSFVNVGDKVKENTVVCIIEAMKLFNEIEAEVTGEIVKFLVDDGTPVDFDQPLMLVKP